MSKVISPHFQLWEFTKTAHTSLQTQPTPQQIQEMEAIAVHILEPLRKIVGPIRINSGFRSPAVNKQVGGVETSLHLYPPGAGAVDIEAVSPSVSNTELAQHLIGLGLPFFRLLLEYPSSEDPRGGWVHVGYKKNENLRQVRTVTRDSKNNTVYLRGLWGQVNP